MIKMIFGNRGLMSLIGIIVVFGITSVTYLELSSSQTKLINTSIRTTQRSTDQNNECLEFVSISENVDMSGYDVQVKNIGGRPVVIHSFIRNIDKSLVGKREVNLKILSGNINNISTDLSSSTTIASDDNLIFITSFGKKCIIPGDMISRTC